MEYQKITNLLNNTPDTPSKIKTKNWVERNDDLQGVHSINSRIKFKTSMLRCDWCQDVMMFMWL